ncbi:MAG: glycosyltransferase family 1 protein, partial [Nanoarchaeota archaeon]
CLRVDFWDVDEMASKILSVLHYTHLHSELQEQGNCEVKKFSWEIPARKCMDTYSRVLGGQHG